MIFLSINLAESPNFHKMLSKKGFQPRRDSILHLRYFTDFFDGKCFENSSKKERKFRYYIEISVHTLHVKDKTQTIVFNVFTLWFSFTCVSTIFLFSRCKGIYKHAIMMYMFVFFNTYFLHVQIFYNI